MNGQPCIRGMRLTVRRVIEALATPRDVAPLKREYPELEDEDIEQALAYAADGRPRYLIPLRVLPCSRTVARGFLNSVLATRHS